MPITRRQPPTDRSTDRRTPPRVRSGSAEPGQRLVSSGGNSESDPRKPRIRPFSRGETRNSSETRHKVRRVPVVGSYRWPVRNEPASARGPRPAFPMAKTVLVHAPAPCAGAGAECEPAPRVKDLGVQNPEALTSPAPCALVGSARASLGPRATPVTPDGRPDQGPHSPEPREPRRTHLHHVPVVGPVGAGLQGLWI